MTNQASAESVVGRHNEGHGRRLTAAFQALEAFPALAESRNRVLRVVREDQTSVGEVVAAVESDVALVITVLRIANRTAQRKKGKIATIPDAVDILSPEGVETAGRAQCDLRLLRTHAGLGCDARAISTPCRRHPGGRRSSGPRNGVRGPRRTALLGAAPRRGQARARARLPGLPWPDSRDARARPRNASTVSAWSWGSTMRSWAACCARRWALPNRLARAIERHHADERRGRGRARAPGRHAGPLRARPAGEPKGAA